MSSLRLATKRSLEDVRHGKAYPCCSPPNPESKKRLHAPFVTMGKLVQKGLLVPWEGGHNDECEAFTACDGACDGGGVTGGGKAMLLRRRLLECSFCNVAYHRDPACLGLDNCPEDDVPDVTAEPDDETVMRAAKQPAQAAGAPAVLPAAVPAAVPEVVVPAVVVPAVVVPAVVVPATPWA